MKGFLLTCDHYITKETSVTKIIFSYLTPLKRLLSIFEKSPKSDSGGIAKKSKFDPLEHLDKEGFSTLYKAAPYKISKEEIIHLLKGVVHQDVSRHVLADISDYSLTVVGRSKIPGTHRQLCHIIPVGFIKEMVTDVVGETGNKRELIEKLSLILTMLAKSQSGFALKSSDLTLSEYSEIAPKIQGNANRVLGLEKETVFLMSPSKRKAVFSTPTKMKKATIEFQKYNTHFIKSALDKLAKLIGDDNTAIIASELITRYIFDLPNSSKHTVFAPEGNTARYEIRLYDDKESALKGSESYEVMTARELNTTPLSSLSERIRIVNSEGVKVKNCIDGLKQLKALLMALENLEEAAVVYNAKYNQKMKLANYMGDLSTFNNPIICNEYLQEQVAAQIAKNLYAAFDLTALENIVFVPKKVGIPVYISAKDNRIVKYGFESGNEFRQDEMDRTHYSDDHFFRNSKQDLELLPQKLVELFLIGISPFAAYQADHPGFATLCLSQLINIAESDYCMDMETSELFSTKVQSIYESILPSKWSYPEDSRVILLGEEFVPCNKLLGFSHDISELFSYA
jgi:hypothetical protein